ncbi:MAG TPA: THUMP domain-containing protein [Nitrospiraceae bacterium]|nr:THUMP domain-containing protein [Nitrospiraceae bacterium]
MDNTNALLFAPCPRGLESVLADELKELGAVEIQPASGGVQFRGTIALCCRVNLQSRIASRVLWQVSRTPYRTEQDLYEAATAVRWEDWFTPRCTIKVKVSAHHCALRSLDFVTLRIKDALCDRFQRTRGSRPSVDTQAPDVLIAAYLDESLCTLYIDTSGEALFKRGWRRSAGEAPLRENLASGILRLAGWSPGTALFDPMCGSGTFVIEAALMAAGIAPGLGRSFALERLHPFDRPRFEQLRTVLREAVVSPAPGLIHAADSSAAATQSVLANLQTSGCAAAVTLHRGDALQQTAPAETGILLTNPPYGHRMGQTADLDTFYPEFGNRLKQQFSGWRVFILTADLKLPGKLRLAPARRTPLFNGAIECRLFEFRMVTGSHRRPRAATAD